jgi:hypothetical protein
VSRLGIECADLGALPTFAALASGSSTDPMIGTSMGTHSSVGSLARFPIFQAGGVDCGWQDESTGAAATAILLPGGADAYAQQAFVDEQVETAGWGDAAHVGCRSLEGSGCLYDVVVGSTWIQLSTYSIQVTPDQLIGPSDAWAREVVAAVAAAGEPLPLWTAPSGTVPTSCAGLLPDISWAGLGELSEGEFDGFILPIAVAAGDQVGAIVCSWKGSTAGRVEIVAIPGAAWAWTQHAPQSNVSLTLSEIPAVGDGAVGGCLEEYQAVCVVHVLAGGGWIAMYLGAPDDTVLPPLEEIATGLVARAGG